jgi:ankyrin repeat protein
VDRFGRTALHYACSSSNLAVVKALAAKMTKALIPQADINKRTALHLAASSDILGETVQHLVKKEKLAVTQGDINKVTPLHLACLAGLQMAAASMLDALSSPAMITSAMNAADAFGRFGCGLALCKVYAPPLLPFVTIPPLFKMSGRTPLHYAAYCGDDKLLGELVRTTDLNVDAQDVQVYLNVVGAGVMWFSCMWLLRVTFCQSLPLFQGQTPLHACSARGHFECVELLLERSASPNIADNVGPGKDCLFLRAPASLYNNRRGGVAATHTLTSHFRMGRRPSCMHVLEEKRRA